MTRAPQSARCRLASGAAMACSSETTVMPDNGSRDGWFMDVLRIIVVRGAPSPADSLPQHRVVVEHIFPDGYRLDGTKEYPRRPQIIGLHAQIDDQAH